MSSVQELKDMIEVMGLTGADAAEFIKDYQASARDERQREREEAERQRQEAARQRENADRQMEEAGLTGLGGSFFALDRVADTAAARRFR